jgi:hypothetical protein
MTAPSSTVLPPELRADCVACVGLCCVALPFDALQGFGFDKAAHSPCRHLCSDFRCGIHDTLEAKGFRGCITFDCQGAGQRVSKRFPDRNWTDTADTASEMFEAFSVMRSLHELMAWLYTAEQHVDDPRLRQQRSTIDALCEQPGVNARMAGEARAQTLALLADPAIRSALTSLRG